MLLEAFERAADKDHNGVVSMSELTSYLAAHRCHGERRAEMHDGGLDAIGRERAVMDLPAPVGAEDDERAFGALLSSTLAILGECQKKA